MTAAELAALPDDGNRYELVRGELIRMAPSVYLPSMVAGQVLVALGGFVLPRRLGRVGSAEGGFLLGRDPDIVRAPDVWFVRAGRVPVGDARMQFFDGAPDIAVEILSPSDRYVDVMTKVREYLDAGAPLVWAIDPLGRSAALFRPGGVAQLIDENGTLDGGDVLPGFSVVLREVLAQDE
jgi:Uma2 family endonuclease